MNKLVKEAQNTNNKDKLMDINDSVLDKIWLSSPKNYVNYLREIINTFSTQKRTK